MVSEWNGVATINVTLDTPASTQVSVSYAVSDGTAAAPNDFTSASGTITFKPGQTTQSLFVPIVNDAIYEGNESIQLTLSGPNGVTLGSQSTASLVIMDDEFQPSVSFTSGSFHSPESIGNATVSVALSGVSATPVTVQISTSDDTVVAGSDYTSGSGTLTIQPGETVAVFSIPVVNDSLAEPDERVHLTLASPSGASLGWMNTANLTIEDDDGPTVRFSSASFSAGENVGSATVGVEITHPELITSGFYIYFNLSGGTAGAYSDYYPPMMSYAYVSPGQSSASFNISLLNDSMTEGDETINMGLSLMAYNPDPNAPTVHLGSPSTAVLTILDDDQPHIAFSSSTFQANEDSGSAVITVTLNSPLMTTSSVKYTTSNGSAGATDFTSSSGVLTFSAGQTSQTFTIPILDDAIAEGDETVLIALSEAVGADLGSVSQATLTIRDAGRPTIRFGTTSFTADEGQGSVTIPIVIESPEPFLSGFYSWVNVTGGTASNYSDFYLMPGQSFYISPSQTSATLTVPIYYDSQAEGDETATFTLSVSPGVADLGTPSSTTLTILDADRPRVQFSPATYQVNENAGTATLTLTLSGPASSTVTVQYGFNGGLATGGADYTPTAGTVTFAPSQTTRSITIPLLDDDLVEGDETILVFIHDAVGATLGSNTAAAITIHDVERSTVALNSASLELNENQGDVTVTVHVDRPELNASGFYAWLNATGGTAQLGTDFTLTSSVFIAAGQATASFILHVNNDLLVEGTETANLELSLSWDANADIGVKQAVVTITDDDHPRVEFLYPSSEVTENEGSIPVITALIYFETDLSSCFAQIAKPQAMPNG